MRYPAGTALLVAILLLWLAVEWSRPLLRTVEAPPAPVVAARGPWLELGAGFPRPGIDQFSDGKTVAGVIALTGLALAPSMADSPCLAMPVKNGSVLELVVQDSEITDILEGWLGAGKRLALGIPLQPDHMSRSDWEVLPGIGPALARRIERDRQINGEFDTLGALRRVRGIGPVRIEAWQAFFR